MASPQNFIALWEKLDVKYDGWAATTEPMSQKMSCRECCSDFSTKDKSTKTNKPATTPFARNNSSPTKNADPTANSDRNGGRSNFARKKTTTSS